MNKDLASLANDMARGRIDNALETVFETISIEKASGNDLTDYTHERAMYWQSQFKEMSYEQIVERMINSIVGGCENE